MVTTSPPFFFQISSLALMSATFQSENSTSALLDSSRTIFSRSGPSDLSQARLATTGAAKIVAGR